METYKIQQIPVTISVVIDNLLWATGKQQELHQENVCCCFNSLLCISVSCGTMLHGATVSRMGCCSVAKSCLTLCDPLDYSMPGFPVHHQLLEFTQTHVHWVGDAIQPSLLLVVPFSCLQSFPASGSFPMSRLFTSGGQNIGVEWVESRKRKEPIF